MGRDLLAPSEWWSWGALGLCGLVILPLGMDWSLGLLAGGGIALGSFRWLRVSAREVLGSFTSRGGRLLWGLGYGFRHVLIFGLLAVILRTGWIHPAGLLLGLLFLPLRAVLMGLTWTPARE